MLRNFVGIALLVAIVWGFFILKNKTNIHTKTTNTQSVSYSEKPTAASEISSKSLFVPYWNLENIENLSGKYDRLIYFGVSATENGVNTEDQGFTNMPKFADSTHNVKTLLTLRMLDSDTNVKILDDKTAQEKIASDIASIAKKNDFAGVVLDLELSALPFSDVQTQINNFVTLLSSELKKNNLYFAMALYGDNYYRARPFNIKVIGDSTDEILIMAYDFHKSRGEPGPNYPLSKGEMYEYDFKNMIDDFESNVDPQKLNIIFGMYGYNWTLGKQGKPLKAATAFSLNDAKQMFYPCSYESCNVNRDTNSAEMKVTYIDSEGNKNESWFEDEDSVAKKTEYLKQMGVSKISYWVNGYF